MQQKKEYKIRHSLFSEKEPVKTCLLGLVWFYVILPIEGYLTPNPFYTYIDIWFVNTYCWHIFKRSWDHSFGHS